MNNQKRSEKNRSFFNIFLQKLLHFDFCYDIILSVNGPLVKRLRRSPLKAESWVRFPYGSPKKKHPNFVRMFLFIKADERDLVWHQSLCDGMELRRRRGCHHALACISAVLIPYVATPRFRCKISLMRRAELLAMSLS